MKEEFLRMSLKSNRLLTAAMALALMAKPMTAQASNIDPALQAHLASNSGETRVLVLMKDVPRFNIQARTSGVQEDRTETLKAFRANAQEAQAGLLSSLDQNLFSASEPVKTFWLANIVALTANEALINQIADRDDVRGVFLNETVTLDSAAGEIPKREQMILDRAAAGEKVKGDTAEFTYGLIKLKVPEMRNVYHLTGQGVTVGILDTGIDANHPDLVGRTLAFKDFINNKTEAYDDHGHGTHVAGTIGGGNTSGLAIGLAPNCKYVVGKIFGSSGSSTEEAILAGMEWIADPDGNAETADAPALVSNSWGGGPGRTAFLDAVKKWVALGIFPSFAAGNSGPGAGTCGTPGGFLESFAVGATDENDGIASFSSRGPVTWNGETYIKPDVSAPGVNITSAKPGGGYQGMSGTSMATPHVSGLLALLYEANPGMTIDQARGILEGTSQDLGDAGKDNNFGMGRVDSLASAAIVVSGGKVIGTLTNSSTGAGVAGTITVAENGLSIKTDRETGAFQAILPEGTYTLSAKSFGYETSSGTTVVVAPQSETQVSITLAPAASGILSGTVVSEETGEPLSAEISVLDTPLDPVSTADAGVFSVSLPAGSYKLLVKAFAYDAKETVEFTVVANETNEVQVSLTHVAPILVVNDAKGKNYDTFYNVALESLGQRFGNVKSEAMGSGLNADFLGQYETVIWLTGDEYQGTLTDEDQEALKTFVNAGGRLFISGQDIGYELKATPFYSDVLKAKFVADTADSKEVSGEGFTAAIQGGDGANNQRYNDKIEALEGGNVLLSYGSGQGPAALTADFGAGKVVYFAFGFEGIDSAENRKAAMSMALEGMQSSREALRSHNMEQIGQ